MKGNYKLFETELTDGSLFRKIKPIYLITGILLLAIVLVYNVFMEEGNNNLDYLFWPFVTVVILFLLIGILLYLFMNKKVIKGNLSIYEDKVEIRQKNVNTYNLNSLENLEIQRGSTYHYTHQTGNEIVMVGNYLRFKINGESKEYEFLIDSQKKNNTFESMISTLQKNRVKFHYTSI